MEVRRLLDAGAASAHTFVFAALPLLVEAGRNGALDSSLGPLLAVIGLATAGLLVATRWFGGSLRARAAWLSTVLLLLGGYATVVKLAAPDSFLRLQQRPDIAVAYTVAALVMALLVRSPWDRSHRPSPLLAGLALVLLAQATIPVTLGALTGSAERVRQAAQLLIQASDPSGPIAAPRRSVYVIVLDGFGSADTLRRLYGVDLSGLTAFLEARGFFVPTRARAPYAQTALSLASWLNMSYLNDVAAAAPPRDIGREPAVYLIRRNAMMARARRAGYRVIATRSEFDETAQFEAVERYVTEPVGLAEVPQAAALMTPFAALLSAERAREAHRRTILQQFDALRASPDAGTPVFMFVHILAPHPPFVFAADGSAPGHASGFTYLDGDHLGLSETDYQSGYAAQARFIAVQVERAVAALLAQSNPEPVIVIMGDHGPASRLHWDDPGATDLAERFGVFSAYLLPDARRGELYGSISPVNAARVLSNHYLGTALTRLGDNSFFSTWNEPFEFVAVD